MDVSIGTTIRNSVHSNSSIQEGFGQQYICNRPVHLFIDIDSHEEIYLSSLKVSSRNWSNCGQLSSSCANAINIGGSCGHIRLVRLGLLESAFVPSSLIPK